MRSKIFLFSLLCASGLFGEVLTFSQAYLLALEHNHKFKSEKLYNLSHKERLKQTESGLYPKLDLSGYYKNSDLKLNQDGSPHTRQGLFNLSLSLKQSIYNPSLYSEIEVEKLRAKIGDVDVTMSKKELAQEVFEAYLKLLKSLNKIELYKAYLHYSNSKLQMIEKKYAINLSNKMDLLEVKVAHNSAKIDLKREKKILQSYRLELEHLIGTDAYVLPRIDSDNAILESLPIMESVVLDVKLKNNLDIQKASLNFALAQKEIKNAYNGHLPKLDLSAGYSRYETDTPTIDAPYEYTQMVMVSLNVPLFSGWYTTSKIDEAKYLQDARKESLADVQKETDIRYEELIASFEAASASVKMYKEAIESAALFVKSVQLGYEHGLKNMVDLDEAKSKYYKIRYEYVENIYELVSSYIGILILSNDFEKIEILDKIVAEN